MSDTMIRRVTWGAARDKLTEVRMAVFVREQGIDPSLEIDDQDPIAVHVLAMAADYRPIGTGRLLPDCQIGRIAVISERRREGLGTRILTELMQTAREVDMPGVWLNAQVDALSFYQRLGFIAEGDVFDDAGLPHRRMRLKLK